MNFTHKSDRATGPTDFNFGEVEKKTSCTEICRHFIDFCNQNKQFEAKRVFIILKKKINETKNDANYILEVFFVVESKYLDYFECLYFQ